MGTTTATKYKQDSMCIPKVYALLQKNTHKGHLKCNEVQGYVNAKGKSKVVNFICVGYITASVAIGLYSLSTPNNADSVCRKLRVKF